MIDFENVDPSGFLKLILLSRYPPNNATKFIEHIARSIKNDFYCNDLFFERALTIFHLTLLRISEKKKTFRYVTVGNLVAHL